MKSAVCAAAMGMAMVVAVSGAWAAGGHHAVDDAAILEPGKCESEGWYTRFVDRTRSTHQGIGCRVGPVELGAAVDYARIPADGSETTWGLQLKWATEVAPGIRAGVSLSPVAQARARPRYQGTSIVALATWAVREDIALHLNIGRDVAHRGRDTHRGGIAAEWFPHTRWSFVAERYVEGQAHFLRAGARFAVRDDLTVDFSRNRHLSGPGGTSWTLGSTWLLDRP